jgi:hypothetical protein
MSMVKYCTCFLIHQMHTQLQIWLLQHHRVKPFTSTSMFTLYMADYTCTESIHCMQWKPMFTLKVRILPAAFSLLNCNMSTKYMDESPSWKVDDWFVWAPDIVSVDFTFLWPPSKDVDSIYELGAHKLMECYLHW